MIPADKGHLFWLSHCGDCCGDTRLSDMRDYKTRSSRSAFVMKTEAVEAVNSVKISVSVDAESKAAGIFCVV